MAHEAVAEHPDRSGALTVPGRQKKYPLPGETFGRYEIIRELGRGGMGVVLLAQDTQLARRVALKFVSSGAGASATLRIAREAQAMAQIHHPNVVSVFDVGERGDEVFIAMEYVEGEDLASWLKTPRAREEIARAFLAAGRGLAAAHAVGIAHRDFKPHNVVIGGRDVVKVTDFGLARAIAEVGPDLLRNPVTAPGRLPGTPRYMAPEQRLSGVADAKSDQFSFALSFAEALGAKSTLASVRAGDEHSSGAVAAELGKRGVNAKLAESIGIGLAAAPELRYPSMSALIAALEAAVRPPPPVARWGSAVMAMGGVSAIAITVAVVLATRDSEPARRDDLGQREADFDAAPSNVVLDPLACFGGEAQLLRCPNEATLRRTTRHTACQKKTGRIWVDHGPVVDFYIGDPLKIRSVERRVDGLRHGRTYRFDRNGQLKEIRGYRDDKLDGLSIMCRETGEVHETREYRRGTLDGETRAWREDGKLFRLSHYRGGQRQERQSELPSIPRPPLCRPTRCSVKF